MKLIDRFLRTDVERPRNCQDAGRCNCRGRFGQSRIVGGVDILVRKRDGALALDKRADRDIGSGFSELEGSGAPHS
jgi:hypothetical protein